MASRLTHERPQPAPPETIAGTFAYMAPEQTGRMNRSRRRSTRSGHPIRAGYRGCRERSAVRTLGRSK
jgi:hypothetical protein